jgi:hypothetical protein
MAARLEKGELPIYTADIETDPFKKDHVPVPFLIGLYDGVSFKSWGHPDRQGPEYTIEPFLEHVDTLDPGIIYMHNGGRFDFFYLMEGFEGRSIIINSRVVCAYRPAPGGGKHRLEKGYRMEFRDSYAIMPFPLGAYAKDKISMDHLERPHRKKHWPEILKYLEGDCTYLWELCMGFQREFGDFKTIASAAFAKLQEHHSYDKLTSKQDESLRGHYYFGGRVQCFQKGVVERPVVIYDVNSMYPHVMSSVYHPTSWPVLVDRTIRGWKPDGTPDKSKLKTFFVTAEGQNQNAFPMRMPDGSVDFTQPEGVFHVSIHEWNLAVALGRFKPKRILSTYSYLAYAKFAAFVDHFYTARQEVTARFNAHKVTCDLCGEHSSISATEGAEGYCAIGKELVAKNLYYKYTLNSAYGKFGLNPTNYYNWVITKTSEERPKGEGWTLDMIAQAKFFVWKQPSLTPWNVKNIGTAASITGAARSILLKAIHHCKGVLYCDTDSLICETFGAEAGELDAKKLGAWKAEGSGVLMGIAGKKTYVVYDDKGVCVKMAAKGGLLEPDEIMRVANGESILTFRDAPTFKLDGSVQFIERTIKRT